MLYSIVIEYYTYISTKIDVFRESIMEKYTLAALHAIQLPCVCRYRLDVYVSWTSTFASCSATFRVNYAAHPLLSNYSHHAQLRTNTTDPYPDCVFYSKHASSLIVSGRPSILIDIWTGPASRQEHVHHHRRCFESHSCSAVVE